MACATTFIGLLLFEKDTIQEHQDKTYFHLYEPYTAYFRLRVNINTRTFNDALANATRTAPLMVSVFGPTIQLHMDAIKMNVLPCIPYIPAALVNIVTETIQHPFSLHRDVQGNFYLVLGVAERVVEEKYDDSAEQEHTPH